MFNICILSGEVLTEPEFKIRDGFTEAIFELGISLGPFKAGSIKICCPQNMAAVAVNSIHKGDRVAVVGDIGRYVYVPKEKKVLLELAVVATDLELVRKDSPALGLTVSDKNPKS